MKTIYDNTLTIESSSWLRAQSTLWMFDTIREMCRRKGQETNRGTRFVTTTNGFVIMTTDSPELFIESWQRMVLCEHVERAELVRALDSFNRHPRLRKLFIEILSPYVVEFTGSIPELFRRVTTIWNRYTPTEKQMSAVPPQIRYLSPFDLYPYRIRSERYGVEIERTDIDEATQFVVRFITADDEPEIISESMIALVGTKGSDQHYEFESSYETYDTIMRKLLNF